MVVVVLLLLRLLLLLHIVGDIIMSISTIPSLEGQLPSVNVAATAAETAVKGETEGVTARVPPLAPAGSSPPAPIIKAGMPPPSPSPSSRPKSKSSSRPDRSSSSSIISSSPLLLYV